MAEDKVKFTVEGKGKNLKKTAKEAKAVGDGAEHAAQGMDRADKAGGKFHRTQKGVAGATSNSTKAFSKMQQGSSGLVGAYATLAANVFAATAAFNALRNAAQMQTMIEGLNAVGAAAGRNLPFAAARLREISGEALSAEASIRTMSLGISAGFRTDQMERLTKVARGASLALGRDMTDALDRLTRGTAKLEPEILDELGIMVRLDDATLKYATTLGKSVEDLTQYERRQAFLNETLEQGEQKFGQLADSIEVNPYDQLGASLNNLAKAGLTIVNDFLGPIIELFIDNQKALIAGLALFATTIFKHLIPGLNDSARKMADSAKATAADAKAKVQNLKVTQKLPKGYRDAVKAMKEGGLTQEKYKAGMASLNRSMSQRLALQAKNTQATAKEIADYKAQTIAIAEVTAAKRGLIIAYQQEQIAQHKGAAADAVELLSQGSLTAGTAALWGATTGYATATYGAAAGGGILAKSWAVLKIAGVALANVLRGVVAVLMGPWGIALAFVGGLIYAFWDDIKELFGVGTEQIKRNSDEAVKAMEQIKDVGAAFNETLASAGEMNASVMVAGFTALNGILSETQSHLKRLDETSKANHRERIMELEAQIAERQELINQAEKAPSFIDSFFPERSGMRMMFGFDKEGLEEEMDGIQKQIDGFKNAYEATLRSDQISVISTLLHNTAGSGEFAKFASAQISDLGVLLAEFAKEGSTMTGEEMMKRLEQIRAPLANMQDAFSGTQDALANFNKETNKLATKQSTPFDKAITAAQVLNGQINQVQNGFEGMDLSEDQQNQLVDAIKEQTGAKDIGELQFDKYTQSLISARDRIIESKEGIKKLKSEQKRLNDIQGKFPMTQQMSIKMSEKQEAIREKEQKALEDTLFLERELAGNQLKKLKTAKENAEEGEAKNLAEKAYRDAEKKFNAQIADSETAILAKINERIGEEEKVLTAKVAQLETEEAMLKAISAQSKAQVKLLELGMQRKRAALELSNLQDPARVRAIGGGITPQQEFALAKQNRDIKIEVIKKNTKMMVDEAKLSAKRVELETSLQLLKLRVMAEEEGRSEEDVRMIGQIMASTAELSAMQINAANLRITAAEREGEIALLNLEVEEKRLGISARRGVAEAAGRGDSVGARVASGGYALKDLAKGTDAYVASQRSAEEKAQKEIQKVQSKYHGYGAPISKKDAQGILEEHTWKKPMEDMVTQWTESTSVMAEAMRSAFDGLDLDQKFGLFTNALQPMIQGLAAAGPEGQALASGLNNIQFGLQGAIGGMQGFKDTNLFGEDGKFAGFADGAEGVAQGVQGVAAATSVAAGMASSLFATQKAASEMAIARIDNEIAAEKKRDGVSSASIAKIKKMEADKEKLKKKAFEQDKKMKIAQAVMGMATGIMQAFATLPTIVAIPMAAMIAALGMKQISLIKSMTYQGGGSGTGGTPSAVAVGSRSNKVDVAGGNAGGELAYMRGERGMGTSASNFSRRGAFTGAKYRAVGGAAYVVGEQGPEVIVPEAPGRIIPNDELGAGGVPINATFNIQTIDASNMEETLVSQRGNIINMIREAANNQGETFLENLDTMALGDSY